MNSAIRDHVTKMLEEARELAHQTLVTPKSEREYMLACGRFRQILRDAEALKERFLDPEEHMDDPEDDLPEFDPPDEMPEPRPRVRPQSDRLARHRARHVPRSV